MSLIGSDPTFRQDVLTGKNDRIISMRDKNFQVFIYMLSIKR